MDADGRILLTTAHRNIIEEDLKSMYQQRMARGALRDDAARRARVAEICANRQNFENYYYSATAGIGSRLAAATNVNDDALRAAGVLCNDMFFFKTDGTPGPSYRKQEVVKGSEFVKRLRLPGE
jgi:hypothetical protein